MRQGTALVISAPSGAGKSTLSRKLIASRPYLRFSISCTTRPIRQDEVDGRDYFFVGREEFEKKRDSGEFAEWAEVHGNLYGTPLAPLRQALDAGHDILLDVDVQGAAQIRTNLPGAYFVFIIPPSMAELERRLRLRKMDDDASIARRLANARAEIREALWYDALVVNDNLEQAARDLDAVYLASTCSPARNMHLVNQLLSEKDKDNG